MSADAYEDCPVCKMQDSVRIDGVNEYELLENGKIINKHIRGRCTNPKCQVGFGKYSGEDD